MNPLIIGLHSVKNKLTFLLEKLLPGGDEFQTAQAELGEINAEKSAILSPEARRDFLSSELAEDTADIRSNFKNCQALMSDISAIEMSIITILHAFCSGRKLLSALPPHAKF